MAALHHLHQQSANWPPNLFNLTVRTSMPILKTLNSPMPILYVTVYVSGYFVNYFLSYLNYLRNRRRYEFVKSIFSISFYIFNDNLFRKV